MSTTPQPAALEINCAKPGCHWKGSPADAPTHTCPTPEAEADVVQSLDDEAPAVGSPFAGLEDIDGKPIPSIERDTEPETKALIELWLNEYGSYTEQGVPNDEKTARLDARLLALQDEREPEPPLDEIDETPEGEPVEIDDDLAATEDDDEPHPQPAPEPAEEEEPDLEEPIAAEAADVDLQGSGELVKAGTAETTEWPGGIRPWQVVVADALEAQTGIAQMRWLVVLQPPEEDLREAELIGRGRIKSDAQEIADKVAEQDGTSGTLAVVKTQDVLEQAEALKAALEVDPQRTNVEETQPETTEAKPEEPAPAAKPETTPEPPPDPEGKALFDRKAFDSPELALAMIDERGVDRIAVELTGGVKLDRSDKADVKLFRGLKLGKRVELRVEGVVIAAPGTAKLDEDDNIEAIIAARKIRVDSIYVLDATQGPEVG